MRNNPTGRAGAMAWRAMLGLLVVLAAACTRAPGPAAAPALNLPAAAVTRLAGDLRRNDLVAYSRHALPPALHARMELAWQERRTIWPLTELPLDDRLPGFVAVLSAPAAEKSLLAAYTRQFNGAQRELRSAASTLGLFAAQYVSGAEEYSAAERDHYVQLVAALSQWGQKAPLSDSRLAKTSVPQLVAAARLTGLGGPGAFHEAGMERSLRRLGPFLARFKQVSLDYGLDLDGALDSVAVDLLEQTGDSARLRLRYTLAGQAIDAIVLVERRQGQWYLSELLRHAEAEAAAVLPLATDPLT